MVDSVAAGAGGAGLPPPDPRTAAEYLPSPRLNLRCALCNQPATHKLASYLAIGYWLVNTYCARDLNRTIRDVYMFFSEAKRDLVIERIDT